MKRNVRPINSTLAFLIFSLCCVLTQAQASAFTQQKRVLMIISSYGQAEGQSAPGYEFDEFAKAYLVLAKNNVAVDIASPTGGKAQADKYNPNKPYNAAVLADTAIMKKLDNTLKTSDIDASQYDGLFVVGGKGAMFDLPKDNSLQTLIADIYQKNGSIAAVCHGPAALIDVKLDDGRYLVEGKAVNGFTNVEEQLFGKKWIPQFDFMLEDKLVERGGLFQSSAMMLNHVAIDGRLITGQNPSSTVAVATELVRSLGIEPAEMKPYKEDATLAMIARVLDGDDSAANQIAVQKANYQIELVGMYGFYYLQTASTDQERINALTLMMLAQEEVGNPRLDMQIAKTQHKLGDAKGATKTLENVLANNPDFEPAQEMLKMLKPLSM